jgi:hypothetical protein
MEPGHTRAAAGSGARIQIQEATLAISNKQKRPSRNGRPFVYMVPKAGLNGPAQGRTSLSIFRLFVNLVPKAGLNGPA